MVLGASGMLGHTLFLKAYDLYPQRVYGTFRQPREELRSFSTLCQIELCDFKALKALLFELKPQYVVNCAGIVKSICTDADEAIVINAALPHFVMKQLNHWGGRLLQVSTDCIFSGNKGNYSETDIPDPEDLYAKTKLMGEVYEGNHLTVRTSFIGYELGTRRGLLEWFLSQKGVVPGYCHVIWSGLTAAALSDILLKLIFRNDITGLLNVTSKPIDKYSLLKFFIKRFERTDIELVPSKGPVIDRSLSNHKVISHGIEIPSISDMVSSL